MGQPAAQPQLDVCSGCGKLYARSYIALCQACALDPDKRFQLVRDYLRDHRGGSIGQVADATGVSRGDISRFYAEGRLVGVDPGMTDNATTCTCQGTNSCAYCRRKLASKFGDMASKMREESGGIDPVPGGLRSARSDDDDDDGRVRYVRRSHRT
jgi:hypothetical protein